MKKAVKRLVFGIVAAAVTLSINVPSWAAEDSKEPVWTAQFQAGKTAKANGETAKAKEQLSAALTEAEKTDDDQGIAEICNELANLYMTEGDIINASANAKRAKDAALKIRMSDPRTRPLASQLAANEENGSVWINHMMKGQLSADKNNWAQAETEFQAASAKAKEYAPDGMPMASALGGLGRALVEQGKYKEAEPVLLQSIVLCEKNWTPVTKNTAVDAAEAMDRLSLVMEKTERKEEAQKLSARSKEVRLAKAFKTTDGEKSK